LGVLYTVSYCSLARIYPVKPPMKQQEEHPYYG
jgi:hypothetical protein